MVNVYIKYLAKFHLTINDLLPVLPGNVQDFCHDNVDPCGDQIRENLNSFGFSVIHKVGNVGVFVQLPVSR